MKVVKDGEAEQTELPGVERPVDVQLENVIRLIKSKTEDATQAAQEKKKAQDKGRELLREKDMPEYTSVKQGFTLKRNDREGVKLQHYTPPKPKREE